ncbi:hypothetical protein F5884DRAFT_170828 [Xylogone sp. PMI_703]|nr:hypothetical protein F5884DRAFT_170828 [Xylogone sp. PMI_703]
MSCDAATREGVTVVCFAAAFPRSTQALVCPSIVHIFCPTLVLYNRGHGHGQFHVNQSWRDSWVTFLSLSKRRKENNASSVVTNIVRAHLISPKHPSVENPPHAKFKLKIPPQQNAPKGFYPSPPVNYCNAWARTKLTCRRGEKGEREPLSTSDIYSS